MFHWLQQLFSGSETETVAAPRPAPAAAAPKPPPAAPTPPPEPVKAASAASPNIPDCPSGLSFDQRDDVNAAYLHWMFENVGEPEFDTNDAENHVLESLNVILKTQQSGATMVRRMPGLIPQLLQSLRSDNFSGAQLSRTISHDVVLVAAVIRMANSCYKSTGTHIHSVEHAVILIGQEGLRHLITSVAFKPIIDIHSGYYTRLLAPRIWDQSERCAVANRILAEGMGVDPFEAFLAGLVQYVGLIVTLRIMDQMDKEGKLLGSEMFCAYLVRDSRKLTCSIGREWNFPESVVLAISEQGDQKKGAPISPMGRLLAQSDYLSKVRLMAEHEKELEPNPTLFKGLSANAVACYKELEAIAEYEPAPETRHATTH